MDLELELFMREIGILAPVSIEDNEEHDDYIDMREICLAKGYYNDPRDENGEVPF